MTKRLRIRLVLLLFVAMFAVGPSVLTTLAGDVSLNGAHWARNKTPFSLRVEENLTGSWKRYLNTAARDWRKSGVVRLRITAADGGNRRACQPRNGQVEVCSARFGDNGWLGLSRIWIDSSNHIVKASITLNDTYFDQAYYNKPKAKQHTICHELGHVLGLDHNNKKSCLNDSNASVFRDVNPSKQDFNRLQRLYKHRDSKATMRNAAREGASFDAASTPALPDDDTFSSSESVHSESLGGGGRVVTFITWADKSK